MDGRFRDHIKVARRWRRRLRRRVQLKISPAEKNNASARGSKVGCGPLVGGFMESSYI